jgi:DNA repair photolyase
MTRLREMRGGADYDAEWGKRMRGQGPYAELIARRFAVAARRHGLDGPLPALDLSAFGRPARAGDQLSLF